MVKRSVAKRALRETLDDAKNLNRLYDKLWKGASKAPIFCKEVGNDKNGVTRRRSARLISPHAYNIAVAGAAAAIKRETHEELARFGMSSALTTDAATLPGFSKGAKYALEQFLCAYAQEAILAATRMTKTLNKGKRLNKAVVREAFEQTNLSIFSLAAPCARATVVVPLHRKSSGKAAGDAYEAADEEGEEAAGEEDEEEGEQGGEEEAAGEKTTG